MTLPPLPEWSKMDDLGKLVPSEIRGELRAYATAAVQAAVAEERESCAKLCALESVTLSTRDQTRGALHCAAAIRARTEPQAGEG